MITLPEGIPANTFAAGSRSYKKTALLLLSCPPFIRCSARQRQTVRRVYAPAPRLSLFNALVRASAL